MDQQLAEAGLQLKQPEPTGEDRAVSFLVPLIQHGSRMCPFCGAPCEFSLHGELFSWILSCLTKADKNKDDKLSQSEMKNFLRLINLEVDDVYAEMLFQVIFFYLEWVLGTKSLCATH